MEVAAGHAEEISAVKRGLIGERPTSVGQSVSHAQPGIRLDSPPRCETMG
jgi:hypothetical protein